MYLFNIEPMGKPRMTRQDKWLNPPRKCVADYWLYKDLLNLEARKQNYQIGDLLDIVFYIPMPLTWSKRKRAEMAGSPHKQTPDTDNLLKGFMDSLAIQDKTIWYIHARKFWAEKGSIFVKIPDFRQYHIKLDQNEVIESSRTRVNNMV